MNFSGLGGKEVKCSSASMFKLLGNIPLNAGTNVYLTNPLLVDVYHVSNIFLLQICLLNFCLYP